MRKEVIKVRSKTRGNFLRDIKTYFPLLINLTSKDFKLKYRRSALGVLWSVLNPMFTMVVIATVFRALLRGGIEHFSIYYIVGWVLWSFFTEATTNSMNSIINGAPLIKKVYIPKYIFPIEKCLFSLVNLMLSFIAVLVVMAYQGIFDTYNFAGVTNLTILLAPIPIFLCFVFAVGFSLIISALTVYFRDIQHLYSVVLTVWMYLTPIIYDMNLIKGYPLVETVVKCNPMFYIVTSFRNLVMYGAYSPQGEPIMQQTLIYLGIAAIISFATFGIGSFIFSKLQKKFILYI